MLIQAIDRDVVPQLIAFIEGISRPSTGTFGLAVIDRTCLAPLTNDQFILAIELALAEGGSPRVFFLGTEEIYVFWQGLAQRVFAQLKDVVLSKLAAPGGTPSNPVIAFMDPQVQANALCLALRARLPNVPKTETEFQGFTACQTQINLFHSVCQLRRSRQKPLILVVDDQAFIRKILKDFLLRDFAVETASTLQDAWGTYLNCAPDLTFLDVELGDGNGHDLACHIKTMDAGAYVVMVTGNNYLSDIEQAKKNKVDGFIAKPFNIQNIRGCLDRFAQSRSPLKKGMRP